MSYETPLTPDQYPEYFSRFKSLLPEMMRESERGRVLVAATYLDELLRQILAAYFVDDKTSTKLLDGFNPPLQTFSARILACHALGLINQAEEKDLNTIRRIRNKFAHSIHVSITDETIASLVTTLSFHHLQMDDQTKTSTKNISNHFLIASVALIAHLMRRPELVLPQRRLPFAWGP